MVAAAEEIEFNPLDTESFRAQARAIKALLAPAIADFTRLNTVTAVRLDPHRILIGIGDSQGADNRVVALVELFMNDAFRWSEDDMRRAACGYAESLSRIGRIEELTVRTEPWDPADPDRVREVRGRARIPLQDLQTTVYVVDHDEAIHRL